VRYRSLCVMFSLLSLLSATALYAEPVRGRVVDPDGRAVAGAKVLLLDGTIIVTTTTTDAAGAFSVEAPEARRYDVRVAVDGFRARPAAVDLRSTHDAGTITLEVSAVSDAVVVSAAQVEIPLSAASSSVTILTGDELAARQIDSVADALRLVPGLAVVSSGGRGSLTSVFPRGGESDYSLVIIDGIQANAFGGGFDFGHLPIVNIDRIEVVRGPQSALYGSNAIGAVIRIVTRRGGPPAGSASVEGGTFGTERLTAATSGARSAWQWGASAEQLSSNGINGEVTRTGERIDNDDDKRHSLAGSLGWQPTGGGPAVRGDVKYSRDERGFPGPFGSDPGGTFSGVDTESRGTNENWLSSIGVTAPIGRRVRTQAVVSYGHFDGQFASAFGDSESLSRRTTGRAQADIGLRPGLDLSTGFEFLRERAGSTFITTVGSATVPVKRSVAGAFAEARWSAAARLYVTGGVRIDRIARSLLEADPDGFTPRPLLGSDTVVSTNPKASAAWYVRPDAGTFTKVRAAAGTGIRPPNGSEIASTDNPSLKPERSRSVEVGVDQAIAEGRALLEATVFSNNFDDLIIAVGSFTASSRYRTDNIANARTRGLELGATARARTSRRVDLQARVGYTYLDADVLAVDQSGSAPLPFAVGDPLLRRPRHQVSVSLLVSGGHLTTFLNGGARSRVLDVDPSFGTFGGLFYAPGFAVWNAGAAYRLHRAVEVFGRIDNLFDRAYEESLGFPALGRRAIAGLRIAPGR
jgi:vitamin B12 transporter